MVAPGFCEWLGLVKGILDWLSCWGLLNQQTTNAVTNAVNVA